MHKSMRNIKKNIDADKQKMLKNAVARRQHLEALGLLEKLPEHPVKKQPSMKRPHGMKSMASMKRQNKSFTMSRMEARIEEHFRGHKPIFTCLITLIQFVILIAMMSHGELAEWGLGVTEKTFQVDVFNGVATQPVRLPENPYYGPTVQTLVLFGSKWAPCMRDEQQVLDFVQESVEGEFDFGCCIRSDSQCGMMSRTTCETTFGETFTTENQTCSDTGACAGILLRPCCFGIYGQCALLTESHCSALDGHWNEQGEECSQTQCINDVCGMTGSLKSAADGRHPNQFYRFITAMFSTWA